MKEITCSFTGHRKLSDEDKNRILKCLSCEIEKLIIRGYTLFLAGGALGFDTFSAVEVLKLKRIYENVKLYIVLPCPEYIKSWSKVDIDKFNEIRNASDKIIYTSDKKVRGCNHIRNRYLIDNSSVCISYIKEDFGGTAYTVKYAMKKGIEIIYIAD